MTRALLLLLAGCAVVPRPEPAPARTHARPAASAPEAEAGEPASAEPAEDSHHYHLAWQRQLPPFTRGLALAPGYLAVLGSRRMSLHELKSGSPLGDSDVCFTAPAGFAFVGAATGALVCEDAIKLFSLPKLAYAGRKALPDKARLAAAGGSWLAVAFASGPLRIFDVGDWKMVREIAVPARPTALAVSADGSTLAIGFDSGDVARLGLGDAGEPRTIRVKPGLEVGAVALSDSGDRLFAAAGPALAIYDAHGSETATFRVAQHVTAARWLEGDVAVIAEDSLLLLDPSDGSAHGLPWTGPPPAELAALGDKGVVCAASHDGVVGCVSRGSLPAVELLARHAAGEGKRLDGRVLGVNGAKLQLKAQPGAPLPAVDTEVLVRRYRERKNGGEPEWIDAARGKVFEAQGDRLTVELHAGHALVPPDLRAFVYDSPVELVWPPGEAAE